MDQTSSLMQIQCCDESQIDAKSPLFLSDGKVYLWLIYIPMFKSRMADFAAVLSKEEVERMKRFYFQRDKIRFVITHGMLRIMIGRYLDISPSSVQFRMTPRGKPEIDGTVKWTPFSWNITHSHDIAVFSFSKFRSIGVDVERVRYISDFQEIANYFHPKERLMLENLPACERLSSFFKLWTLKEAFVKATGEGLSRPLTTCIYYIV